MFSYLDISAAMGLCATGLLTLNFLLGMLLSTAYKRSVAWKKLPAYIQKISLDNLHNITAYIALLFVVLHPLFLLLEQSQHFTIANVLWPVNAPKQSNIVFLGTISFYALLLVMVTTQQLVKKRMRFRLWKNVHLVSYGTALLFLLHGIWMDPQLKDSPTDFLDAEKVFSETCLALVAIAFLLRVNYHRYSKNKG